MNRKRNVNFIKPEDPAFIKDLKKQAGYDDRNHKFDELENADDLREDEDSEKPQVVVLKKGDLTADEAEEERKKIEKEELETKADLTQRVIFKRKQRASSVPDVNKLKRKGDKKSTSSSKKKSQLLSFDNDEDEEIE